MGRYEYMERFNRRAKDEADERATALRLITAICKENIPDQHQELGVTEWQADKMAIDAIRTIINELPE